MRGAAAGAVATGAMSLVMYAAKRFGLMGDMPPEKITSAALDSLGVNRTRTAQDVLASAAHLGFGSAAGGLFGVLHSRAEIQLSPVLAGMAFGSVVWIVSYGGWVPALGIMPPPERDRPGRAPSMLLAHLVYGAALGAMVGATCPSRRHRG